MLAVAHAAVDDLHALAYTGLDNHVQHSEVPK